MEKSRSYPRYSSQLGCEDQTNPYSYTFNGPMGQMNSGTLNEPEMKRKKRIAAYNLFTKEGKVKASVRDSFKWIKTKINHVRNSL
ncbi:hypothetical protein ABFS82_14G304200 [Erythranthe guttata]|uniref:DUF3511 domain-containing protein n=1 Tax=Erythranthe guttata TaxID=4155 RepID=A0A022RD48_ERYGU|nr:hypothetical protein MIMGU_mgv1a017284mg [Erythranthe guttata]